jgi:4-hydroxymandelate oxidase
MGGVNNSRNFQLNCADWKLLRDKASASGGLEKILSLPVDEGTVSIGPVTGAQQNIGYAHESDFYLPYFTAAHAAGIGICAGDGYPDEKLLLGLEAVRTLQKDDDSLRAAVFLKPYPNDKLLERIEWCEGAAGIIGNDIDSYNIVTMRNLVHLEKKTPQSIAELRKHIHVPFALKGIFTSEGIELVKQVKPDIAVISNHGGRVDTREGSTALFLAEHGEELKEYCGELWVDGGIRTKEDIQTALYYGASHVIVARPFIAALVKDGINAMIGAIREIIN